MKKILLLPFLMISISLFSQKEYKLKGNFSNSCGQGAYSEGITFNPDDNTFLFDDYNSVKLEMEKLEGTYSFDGKYLFLYYNDRPSQKLKVTTNSKYSFIKFSGKRYCHMCTNC